jgi:1,4-alpha-glucan branching enzyme
LTFSFDFICKQKELTVTTELASSIQALLECRHENPFSLLGPQPGQREARVRAYLPFGKKAWVVDGAQREALPMQRIHPAGLYETALPNTQLPQPGNYQLRIENHEGQLITMHDPYAFPPMMTDYDLYLLGEGRHWEAYQRLGAHGRTVKKVTGVNFAVWAPNASGVSVVGDFNGWDGRTHQMRKHIPSGIWELFIPDVKNGDCYKYRVFHNGHAVDKSDPYGFAAELPPRTGSIVADLDSYQWDDYQWMERRGQTDPLRQPASIYEVHLGSWKMAGTGPTDWLDYRDLAHQLVDYCLKMHYTHIELLPVTEHPFTGSWGYQTVGYHAVTSRFGPPQDFMYFVDHCHQHGIGVILDWVPAHFPRDDHGLRRFDGTALYEHDDPRQGEHPDWGTLIFNYGRSEVRNFLLSNALFWLDKYHIDGLRVDAVASMLYLDYSRENGDWIPNEYGGRENLAAISLLKEFNEIVHQRHPGVLTIAEESTAWGGVSRPTFDGGLGFSLKWNMGWMNDTIGYFQKDPIHRRYHHNELTFSMIYAFTENFTLPLSHDEVVHGKGSLLDQMPGDIWQKFANLRLLYGYMWTHPGKKTLYMGNDIAQWNEWNHDTSLQWHLLQWESHQGMQQLVADLNRIYQQEPALYEVDFENSGFEWIDCMSSEDCVLVYMRKAKDPADFLVVCCNFTPVPRADYRVGVPQAGWYQEILNTDSEHYGGTNVGSHPGRQSEPIVAQARPHSISVNMPPLGVVIFKPS